MQLVGEALGVGLLVWWLPQWLGGTDPRTSPHAIVTTVLGGVLTAAFLWPAGHGLFEDGRQNAALSPSAAAVAGSVVAPARADFFNWVAARLPANATFFLFAPESPSLWGSYQLTPRRQVSSVAQAQYLVFYDTTPQRAGGALAFFPHRAAFAAGYSIAARS